MLMVEARLDFETWAREAGFFTYPFRIACSVLQLETKIKWTF